MANEVTYDSLINDQNFQRLARQFYTERDKDAFKPKSAKDVVDYFMKDRSWTDDNLTFGAIPEATSIGSMSPEQRARLAKLKESYRQVPLAGFPGGRGFLGAAFEHTVNNLADPINYIGAGIGGLVTKKLGSKALGVITGAGVDAAASAGLEGADQSVEKDVGMRKEIDPVQIGAAGALGGAASLGAQTLIPMAVRGIRGLMSKPVEPMTPTPRDPGPWGARPKNEAPAITTQPKTSGVARDVTPEDVFAERRAKAGMDVDPIMGQIRGQVEEGGDTFDLAASLYRQKYNDFMTQRRNVQPWGNTSANAKVIRDGEDFVERTLKIKPGTTKNAEEQGAIAMLAGDLKNGIENKLAYLNRTMDETGGQVDPVVLGDLIKNMKLLGITFEKMRGLKTETARALNYQKEINRMMMSGQFTKEELDQMISQRNMADLLKEAQGKAGLGTKLSNATGMTGIIPDEEINNILRRGSASENFIRMLNQASDTEIALFSEKMNKPGWSDKAKEYMMFAYLSNPQTWVVNALGTGMNVMAEQLLVRPMSVPIGMVRRGLSKVVGHEAGERASADEIAAGIKSIASINGIWDALKIGGRAFWDEGYQSPYRKQEEQFQHAVGGKLGKITRFPMRVLNSTDAMLGSIAERARLHSEAQKAWTIELRDQASHINTMTDAEKAAYRQNFFESFLSDPPEDIKKIIEKEGRLNTFTQKLNPLMQSFSDIVNSNTAVGLIMKTQIPFLRTPFNVTNHSMDYVPLIPGIKRAAGKYTAEEFDRMMARQVLGSIGFAASVYYGFLGLSTGSGPADPKEREIWEAGMQNRKFTFYGDGKNGVMYNRMDPFSINWGLGNDVGYFLRRVAEGKIEGMTPEKIAKMTPMEVVKLAYDKNFLVGLKDVRGEDAWKAIAHSIQENITSKSFLEGIQNLLKTGSEQTVSQTMQNTLKNIVVPRGIAALTRQIDPIVRQPEGIMQAIASDIPGLSKQVPPRIGALEFSRQNLGQDVEKKGPGIVRKYEGGTFIPWSPKTDKGFPVSDFLSPYYRTTRSDDPLAKDVSRYYKELSELGRPEKYLNNSRVKLTPDQLNEFTSARNLFFRQIMDPFAQSPGWQNIKGELQNKMVKIPIMEDAMKKATKQAFAYMVKDRPELMKEFVLSNALDKLKFDDPSWTRMMLETFGYKEMPQNIHRRW